MFSGEKNWDEQETPGLVYREPMIQSADLILSFENLNLVLQNLPRF
jgi:hypothetical protein